MINHYESKKIDPKSKTIVFSDGLDVDTAIKIQNYRQNEIKRSFGIGTNFTNDIENSKPLNMVIKLWKVNNNPVVKLSDVPGKETGEEDAIKVAKWMFYNEKI